MNYVLFDDPSARRLLPLTFTRPVAEIRVGILKISEKWERMLKGKVSFLTAPHLQEKFPAVLTGDNVFINGCVIPTPALIDAIKRLEPGQALQQDEKLLAVRTEAVRIDPETLSANATAFGQPLMMVKNNWDIFSLNDAAIRADFDLLTRGRKSAAISDTNKVLNPQMVFLEEGAKVDCAILNAMSGPIYIGKDAEVWEGAMIRGPFALGEHAQVKMGAKIYGATTIGPYCKVGGEISNSVMFGYSNKGHDGFLGNSVLGEWCNLGADTNNSNLKNNYSKVKVWSYEAEDYVNTGLQFCGLIMGDHSKCSINTMFNTGTVVGVSANIFGNGFPPKFVPSFSWGGSEGFTTYRFEDALEVASRVYERRSISLDEVEKKILRHIFDSSTKYRSW